VLGPITIGKNARVGSNAVVAKDVPEGATAVGIPARVIVKADTELDARRKAMADKIGFEAYGVSSDMPDPIARSINNMLDHMHAVDAKISQMCKALEEMGRKDCSGKLPDLKDGTFVAPQDTDKGA
jgi:serine O-acetyltransferase